MVGFLLSTGASLLMNGVCCIYSMNEEKGLREAMRQDIRDEWRQQREIESRERQQREAEAERLLLRSLELRHQKLMASSTGGAECIYETRMQNHNEILDRSQMVFHQDCQRRFHGDHHKPKKAFCPAVSIFDMDFDEDEVNPQEAM